jgi:hypothetical protein
VLGVYSSPSDRDELVTTTSQHENGEQHSIKVRRAGIFNPPSTHDKTIRLVSPIDDGSIYIWDVRGHAGNRGRIIARSATIPYLLPDLLQMLHDQEFEINTYFLLLR